MVSWAQDNTVLLFATVGKSNAFSVRNLIEKLRNSNLISIASMLQAMASSEGKNLNVVTYSESAQAIYRHFTSQNSIIGAF